MEKPCQNHVFQRNDPIIIIIMIIIINACTDCGPSFQNAKLSPPEVRLPVVHAGLDFAVAWACFGKKIPKQQHAGWGFLKENKGVDQPKNSKGNNGRFIQQN